ncbi:sigma-70 family RNA polymerase sigma factor [Sphingobium sp. H39-3-25]|uniref:RNA polymerase sigma factor n=1 Tax=Sphingobium arseniciresistens TaxID=3030834 RepID=UPI0023B8DF3C|nr:sigma-70 family RNA polymerase sigma factor [Sphingobium arseniciresistens]
MADAIMMTAATPDRVPGRWAVKKEQDRAEGLAAMLMAHRPQLLRFLTSRTGSSAEAEDVLQEIWLHVARADTGPIANPSAFLYRTGMNIVLDRVRERQRRVRREQGWSDAVVEQRGGEATDESPSPYDVAEGRERARRLATAIDALPPGAGRVFRRHKLDGLSHAEVAAEFGISRSAVEKHIAVALRHLREAIER